MKQILVVNDDGINNEGIRRLAQCAKSLGQVTVVAPSAQCSAMSHKITISYPIRVMPVTDFPVDDVAAYRVDGTPADCTMLGITSIMDKKPDLVLSGFNDGFNTGFDTIYSGTVAAAREALLHGVPGIALSVGRDFIKTAQGLEKTEAAFDKYRIAEAFFDELMEYTTRHPAPDNAIWNINFPMCPPEEANGILYDVTCAKQEFYGITSFDRTTGEDGAYHFVPVGAFPNEAPEGTDMHAVLNGYIAAGLVACAIL